MRFSCNVFIKKGTVIPSDYRRHLLSLVKESIKKSSNDGAEFYSRYYSENTTKPFTFSAYIPMKNENGKSLISGDFFSFFFSSNDFEFLMRVYNGLLKINLEKNFKLFGENFSIKKIIVLPEKKFEKDTMVFKTLSPFLVRDTENGDNYLYPKDFTIQTRNNGNQWQYWKEVELTNYLDSLKKNIEALVGINDFSITLGKNIIVPILHGSGNDDHSFVMTFPGMKGEIEIQANPEILKLIYDIGIGARRSEGFGMLEVVE